MIVNDIMGGENMEVKSNFKGVWFGDIVKVDDIRERIILKRSKVIDWINNLKRNQKTCGCSQSESDLDNFLQGYNEAVEDILYILGMSKIPVVANKIEYILK